MSVGNWGVLLWLGLAGVGCGGSQGDALSGEPGFPSVEAVPAATVEVGSRRVSAQACPPGVASRVAAITPPGVSSFMGELTHVQGALYFITSAFASGSVLWHSDGTEAGTVPVKSFPGPPGVFQPMHLVAVGNRLFFQTNTEPDGMALWISDGTEGGTRMLKVFPRGVLRDAYEVNGSLMFFLWGGSAGPELWRSDGTAAGTLRVRNFSGYAGLNGYYMLKAGNAVLFFFANETGTTLWRTDGTLAGTTSVKRLDGGLTTVTGVSRPGEPPLFILKDGPNFEVWKTNGTAEGTARLDSFGKPVYLLGTLGESVYVTSVDSPVTNRLRIDRLSLNGGGKTRIATLPNTYGSSEYTYPYAVPAGVSGNDLYFSRAMLIDAPSLENVSLWATNGSAAGTRKLFDNPTVEDGYSYPVFATGEGQVLFGGAMGAGGRVIPYFTQGSVATQGKLADIFFPNSFTRVGNRIFFTASDVTGEGQLWSVPATFSCPPGLTEARQ